MNNIAAHVYNVFEQSILDYHVYDDVNFEVTDPYNENLPESLLYRKNWIDTVQWHLEDLIRDPDIRPESALSLKRRIDALNQQRTDIVELIDDYFYNLYGHVIPENDARHNTESLGWALDRLSILALKEYHLNVELERADASLQHRDNTLKRKQILECQKEDLMKAIDWLHEDISLGKKINKVYRQLKMYNDRSFNPVLYKKAIT
jgi:hypothetical protein